MAVTLIDILSDYYDFLGDDVPSAGTDQDLRLINNTMLQMCRRYKFGFARVEESITFASGVATLPSLFDKEYDLRYSDDVIFTKVDETQRGDGNLPYRYWITGDPQNYYKLNKADTTYDTLTVRYYKKPAQLAQNTDETFFPTSEPIALGAYWRKRRVDNPDIDTSQEQGAYEAAFSELVSADQKLNNRKSRYIGIREAEGQTLGE